MNQAKYEAARKLNDQENNLKIINEQIASIEALLAKAKASQALVGDLIRQQLLVVAAMPD